MKLNAFITAGGRIDGEFARRAGTDIKALIKLGGTSLVQRAIEAMRGSGHIEKIALIAPREMREMPDVQGADYFIPASRDGVENILLGLRQFQKDKYVILSSSDLPFVTVHSVKNFIARCPANAAVCYPVFLREEIDPDLRPGVPSYVKLRDGHFTGGSIFRLETGLMVQRITQVGESFHARKSAFDMARLLGWKILLKFLLGICSLDDILKRGEEILGGKCAAVRGCDPAITLDIDDERSYDFAMKLFEGNSLSGRLLTGSTEDME